MIFARLLVYLSVLKRCVPKTLAFAFGLRLRSKTRCFKTRVLGRRLPTGKPQERLRFIRKREGVQKSMGNKVPWETGVLIYLPVTSRPVISLQKEAVLSPCNFATTHLTACILNFHLP